MSTNYGSSNVMWPLVSCPAGKSDFNFLWFSSWVQEYVALCSQATWVAYEWGCECDHQEAINQLMLVQSIMW